LCNLLAKENLATFQSIRVIVAIRLKTHIGEFNWGVAWARDWTIMAIISGQYIVRRSRKRNDA